MDIKNIVNDLQNAKHKLLLVIGQPGSGKSRLVREYSEETGIPILDLNKVCASAPSHQLMHVMKDFLSTYHQKVLLIDNKQILYDKNHNIDLMAFLKEISQDIIVVSTWNGKIEDGQVFHFCKEACQDSIYSVQREDFKYILC